MKRSDFKEFKRVYLSSCKKLIEDKGACKRVTCDDCPFDETNNINKKNCIEYGYVTALTDSYPDPMGLKSALEYLELYGGKDETD